MNATPTILFAGGGSGGHLQPAQVLARALLGREPQPRIAFVLSGRAVERRFIPAGIEVLELFPQSPNRPGAWRLDRYGKALYRAHQFVRSLKPDLMVLLGGYVSGLAWWVARHVPSVLLESNRIPGHTSRIVAQRVRKAFLQWPPPEPLFPPERMSITGMPLPFDEIPERAGARRLLGLDPSKKTLLVMGGSQGASAINRLLAQGAVDLAKRRVQVIHLSGDVDAEQMRQCYRSAHVGALVLPFTPSMDLCYAAADLVVARAGGMSVAELAAAGRAALFVPYPHHRDHHQEQNARMLVQSHAAWMMRESDCGADFVRQHVLPLLQEEGELLRRECNAFALGRRDATNRILAEMDEILPLKRGSETEKAA